MLLVKDLIKKLEKVSDDLEVRIVNQYDEENGETYHNEINDVYISSEDGRKDVIVLESNEI